MLIIRRARFVTSLDGLKPFEGQGLPEVALAGKSNVGKSSLINRVPATASWRANPASRGKTRPHQPLRDQFSPSVGGPSGLRLRARAQEERKVGPHDRGIPLRQPQPEARLAIGGHPPRAHAGRPDDGRVPAPLRASVHGDRTKADSSPARQSGGTCKPSAGRWWCSRGRSSRSRGGRHGPGAHIGALESLVPAPSEEPAAVIRPPATGEKFRFVDHTGRAHALRAAVCYDGVVEHPDAHLGQRADGEPGGRNVALRRLRRPPGWLWDAPPHTPWLSAPRPACCEGRMRSHPACPA